jgi:hypothetical protein
MQELKKTRRHFHLKPRLFQQFLRRQQLSYKIGF